MIWSALQICALLLLLVQPPQQELTDAETALLRQAEQLPGLRSLSIKGDLAGNGLPLMRLPQGLTVSVMC